MLAYLNCVPKILATLGAAILLAGSVMESLPWTVRHEIAPSDISQQSNRAFVTTLRSPVLGLSLYGNDATGNRVEDELQEDGQNVGPGQSLHDAIREQGGGAFSHWHETLYFSSSDGSDPRSGKHRYVLVTQYRIASGLFIGALTLLLLGVVSESLRRRWREGRWHAIHSDLNSFRRDPTLGVSGAITPGRHATAYVVIAVCSLCWSALFLIPGSAFAWASGPLLFGQSGLLVALCLVLIWRQVVEHRFGALDRWLIVFSVGCGILLLTLPLFEAWRSAKTTESLIAGLLPYNDATGYYNGGLRLLVDGGFDAWNMRRPVNAAWRALWLNWLGGDLRATLAFVAIALGISTAAAALEVTRAFGAAMAGLFILIVYGYARTYLPTTLTATHGLVFSCLAVALLLRAGSRRSLIAFGLSMGAVSLALDARSGAFLIVPALLLWGALFIDQGRWSWRALVVGICAAGLALLVPVFFNSLWGEGKGLYQSNFAYVLYGMAAGGGGWQRIYVDHPLLFSQHTEESVARQIYAMSVDLLLTDPLPFLRFYFSELARFPDFLVNGLFKGSPYLRVTAGTVFLFGVILTAWQYRRPVAAMLLFSTIGIFFSAPFLMLDGGSRVFASTYPFLATVVIAGLGYSMQLLATVRGPARVHDEAAAPPRSDLIPLGFATIATAALGPLQAAGSWASVNSDVEGCPAAQKVLVTQLGRTATELRIVSSSARVKTYAPTIVRDDLVRYGALTAIPFGRTLIELKPPYSLILGYNHAWRRQEFPSSMFWAIVPGTLSRPPAHRTLVLCGTPYSGVKGWEQHLFEVTHYRSMPYP